MNYLFLSVALSASSFGVLLLSLLLAFVLGQNNSALTTGNLSNFISYNAALVVTLLGIFVGIAAEGSKMSGSILGKLITTSIGASQLIAGIATTLVLFSLLSYARIPVSLSNCIVGSFVGVALGSGAGIGFGFLVVIVTSWIFAPIICAALTTIVYSVASRSEGGMSLPTISWLNRLLLLGSVFYLAYALGANNIGLILYLAENRFSGVLSPLFLAIPLFGSAALGTVLFGKTIAKIVGDKITGLSQMKTLAALLSTAIVTWAFTQLSIPISLTQVVIGGMLGAGAARGPAVANRREVLVMIRDWIIVTVLCAVVGFAVIYLTRFF